MGGAGASEASGVLSESVAVRDRSIRKEATGKARQQWGDQRPQSEAEKEDLGAWGTLGK